MAKKKAPSKKASNGHMHVMPGGRKMADKDMMMGGKMPPKKMPMKGKKRRK